MIIKQDIYDGNLIHSRFAYKFFRDKTLPIGNIVAFRAPMCVEAEGMIDNEDILSKDYIYSDDAINFCWEIPNLCPFGAVAFQRLLNTQIANILSIKYLKAPVEVDGDDLMVHKEHTQGGITQPKGKASVSITYCKNGTALGHTAINIVAGKKAPAFAYSTNLTNEQATAFMSDIIGVFYPMVDDIFIATSKVIA
jgi:hypothetical protein|tara:strand:+ start:5527 stop:6111 length:585 start_codon:yes stop_codon:yes gene_type:complete